MKQKTKNPKQKRSLKDRVKNFFKIPDEVFEEEESPKFERQKLFTLTRTNIFVGLALFLLLINIIIFTNLDFLYLRQILGFLFLVSVPGLILMLCFKIRNIGFWEYLVYTVGLSISFIMFAGLIVNWTLPYLGITNTPLSLYPILICFDIFLIVLGIVAFIRNKDFPKKDFTVPKLDRLNNIMFTIPMLFPVLSILGAFLLNNHGTNILTMVMLGGIAVYALLLTFFRKKLDKNIWPWAIWMIAMSILLSWSMRGMYINGVDMNNEFGTFTKTLTDSLWGNNLQNHWYWSMLSVTILPTILKNLINVDSTLILKLFITLIYAFVPIIMFCAFKDSFKKLICFFASLFFIFQPMFLEWWLVGSRQQIAFVFFGLMILVFFAKQLSSTTKKILFVIFGASMVVSHYSTSYIAIALFALTYIILQIHKFWERKKSKKIISTQTKRNFYLTSILIIFLLLFGFFWYSQVTTTSNFLTQQIGESVRNIGDLFNEDLQKPGSSLTEQFSINQKRSMYDLMKEYLQSSNFETNSSTNSIETRNFLTIPSIVLKSYEKQSFLSTVDSILQLSVKLLFVGGFLFIFLSRKNPKIKIEQKLLFASIYLLVGTLVIMPLFSISYDLARTFQQAIILVSPIIIAFSVFTLRKCKIKGYFLIALCLIIYLLVFSGFVNSFLNIYNQGLNLENGGDGYDKFFAHEEEVLSSDWFITNTFTGKIIADAHGANRIASYNDLFYNRIISEAIMPLSIQKNYIFSRYTNTHNSLATKFYKTVVIYYEFPQNYLDENKNKVYSNGGSEIYK